MNLLSRSEEIILLAVLKLKNNAYGVTIREQIQKDTGNLWSFASIYTPLEKLNRKRFVIKVKGKPTRERGGKSKFLYQITDEGKQALIEIRRANEQVWSGALDLI